MRARKVREAHYHADRYETTLEGKPLALDVARCYLGDWDIFAEPTTAYTHPSIKHMFDAGDGSDYQAATKRAHKILAYCESSPVN